MREFPGGATRDNDEDKPDFEGFLSPTVIVRYGEYMSKHRVQVDGNVRDSDNWQKGIPLDQYLKSLLRHLVDVWQMHRDPEPKYISDLDNSEVDDMEEALCAILFNASGYLHEYLKGNLPGQKEAPIDHCLQPVRAVEECECTEGDF